MFISTITYKFNVLIHNISIKMTITIQPKQLEALLQLNQEEDQKAFRTYHDQLSSQYGRTILNAQWIPYQARHLTIDGASTNSQYMRK